MSTRPPVELVLLWHHHQPDYRRAQDGCAVLPWVRLHATKDYLDMALRLERHPGVRMSFNFVPSLLDQIDDAAAGGPDLLFDRLARPVAELAPEDRDELLRRCVQAPRHAFDRWPAYRALADRLRRAGRGPAPGSAADRDLVRLECWFLLAWIDPMFLDEPEASAALAAAPDLDAAHRDALLALHRRLAGRVIGAYRARAEAGQIELSVSPYYHPILPLLVDLRSARRARPDLPLPNEPMSVPDDAMTQIERARARAARAFGAAPVGMWPPEGSVSPEALAIAASCGVRWLATDEGVLWQSLDPADRKRESLYRPWRFDTGAGEVAMFFRDHELSDRIGFVYQHWHAAEAVADFMERLRRIGGDHASDEPRVVSVVLDGENCWESYPEDGGPFLDALYAALAEAPDIVTRTPADYLGALGTMTPLARLHTGSWIDADFHIWIGHPEKNRGWDLVARTRRMLADRGVTPEQAPEAWESMFAAEGSDWFWWFGEDHFTSDKAMFDNLFRSHLQAVYERLDEPVPSALEVPIVGSGLRGRPERVPVGFIRPVIDGRQTDFFEWHGAGHFRLTAGGSAMHHGAGVVSDLRFGFDAECVYLRVDFIQRRPPGADHALALEFSSPAIGRIEIAGLEPGQPAVAWTAGERSGCPVEGARAAVGTIVEVSLPFASLGLAVGQPVELLARITQSGQPVETLPADDILRFKVPAQGDEARTWSA